MKTSRNAKRYANMFLNAVGMDDAPKALEELATAEALMQKSREFKNLLQSPVFGSEERTGAVEAVGGRLGFSENTVRFVGFLADNGEAWAMPDVLKKAVTIYSERKNKVKATVITPVSFNGDYESRLKEALGKITSKDVTIEYATDPSLLGGVLIKVGSTMFDGTIKGQLRLLKDELIKG